MHPGSTGRTRRSIIVGSVGGVMGVFGRVMEGLAVESADPKTVMIDATYLKAHRTASSLRLEKGGLGG
jgi:hypothetical protein